MILILFYLVNSILYTITLKSIDYYYDINNLFFSCFLFGMFFPFVFLYSNINQLVYQLGDYVCGILDYSQLILFYVSINNITIAEYLSYRTSSLIFNLILSYLFMEKELSYTKLLGIFIIMLSCTILLIFSGISNIFYSSIVLLASFIYSIINFIVEKYPDKSNYIQTKCISGYLCIFTYMVYTVLYSDLNITIRIKSDIILWLMISFMSFSEFFYYFIKTKILNNIVENKSELSNSDFLNIIDTSRRVVTLILGIVIFNDKYESYYYICFFFICIGCIFIQFSNNLFSLCK